MGNTPRIRDYPVVAIFKVGMSDYDDDIVYMPIAEAQEYFVSEDGASRSSRSWSTDPDEIGSHDAGIQEAAGPTCRSRPGKDRNRRSSTRSRSSAM